MKIVLSTINDSLFYLWEKEFTEIPQVTIFKGSILESGCDAITAPGNSFGFMGGGLDEIIRRRFGKGLEERLQQAISIRHHGELVVGCAEIIYTRDKDIRYVVYAPTMRIPMTIKGTVNPYLATRAAILACLYDNVENEPGNLIPANQIISSLSIPAMGTGVGKVPFRTATFQMRQAIIDTLIVHKDPHINNDVNYYINMHKKMTE